MDATAAEERYCPAEAELKTLCDEQAARTHQLEEQEEKLKTREASLTE